MLSALNKVQSTAWRVNTFVLDVMRAAFDSGEVIGDMPAAEDTPLPPKVPDKVWEKMEKTEKARYKLKLSQIHSHNAKLVSKRETLLRKLTVANSMRDEEVIYFPHNLDFRGRLYPLPQDLNPQGDDMAKSLLMFAKGKPVDRRGLWWLAIAVANTFGHDKLPLDQRYDWTIEKFQWLEDSAFDPLGGKRFWTTADDPWMALALTSDFITAFRGGLNHVPVSLDGSCNGLQHLAAWGLDPVGAKATNLAANDERQDLYALVAQKVTTMVQRDAATDAVAKNWLNAVDRKTVKRAVMTTPYGVTKHGIAIQLVADGATDGLEGYRQENANYLRDRIVDALETTVVSAKEIMGYFQKCAEVLAKNNLPLRWETPAGMQCLQAYWNKDRKKVSTLLGEVILFLDTHVGGLNSRKQILASAPNIIHSFDAAHLTLTVNECTRVAPDMDLTFVHDSYGTHACDVDKMRDALRKTFVDMYEHDPIEKFAARLSADYPDIVFPEPPRRGAFVLKEVLRSDYFFA